jgi:hypothetical protein
MQGALVQYADYGAACSYKERVESDKSIVFYFLMLLLGFNSIAFNKFELGCTINFIKHYMSLQYSFVGVTHHTLLKAIYAL